MEHLKIKFKGQKKLHLISVYKYSVVKNIFFLNSKSDNRFTSTQPEVVMGWTLCHMCVCVCVWW